MKCLIIGANGMLGKDLAEVFKAWRPVLYGGSDLNITDEKAVENKIKALKPELIINAAAYTKVDDAENNEETAVNVNGYAVGYLAKAAKKCGSVLIHYSTDYVFGGTKISGYRESDIPNPINAYGRSKLIGEKELMKNCRKYYLIRTSWLYGKNGNNFVDKILNLSQAKKEIKVVNDQYGMPTYSVDLAQATFDLVNKKMEYGIYHITNRGMTNWFEFAKYIFNLKKIKLKLTPVSSDAYVTAAKRPAYSGLISEKMPPLRDWKKALADYLSNNK